MSEHGARALTSGAARWLARRLPGSLIVEELSVGNWGSLRLDLGAITEDGIVAVEVKGLGDDMSRLKLQGPLYGIVATTAWLLPCPSLDEAARKARPQGWGLLELGPDGVRQRRHYSAARLPTSPGQLLQALWGIELRALCDELGVSRKGLTRVDQWTEALAEAIPLRQLRPAVCGALRRRDWYKVQPGRPPTRPGRVRWAEEIINAVD